MMKFNSHILGGSVVLSGLFASALAQAQDAPPPPAAEAPAPAPAPAPPPAAEPAPAPAAEPPPLPAPAPVPEAAAEAAPAADNPFKVTVGAGFRAGVRIQNPNTPASGSGLPEYTKLNDQFLDELNAELRVSGKVTDIIGWTANFTVDGRTRASAGGGAPIAFQAQALDIIGQLDFMDEFHVWLGRMLTPSDRSNFSGAWFMAPWNYSGVIDSYYGPRGTEEVGREVGGTVWGDIGKGKFKYYAMVGDLDSNVGPGGGFAGQSPLYSLRAQYAFIGAEPGFYGSSTYYGGQDIVALGAAFQYQKDYAVSGGTDAMGNANPDVKDNLTEFNADLLAEFKTGAGTPGIEGAFYLEKGDTRGFDNFFYVLPTFTTGEILPAKGKLNASVRFQMVNAGKDTPLKRTATAIEPSVAYLFKDYFAKLQLTYSMLNVDFDDEDAAADAGKWKKQQFIQLGFQIQQ